MRKYLRLNQHEGISHDDEQIRILTGTEILLLGRKRLYWGTHRKCHKMLFFINSTLGACLTLCCIERVVHLGLTGMS